MYILGISAYYHDSAATLIKDGAIVCAVQEERFSRIKHDKSFPLESIKFCLNFADISMDDVWAVAYFESSREKVSRIFCTYISYAPRGLESLLKVLKANFWSKLFIKNTLKKEIAKLSVLTQGGGKKRYVPNVITGKHHRSHAASAFYPSPFESAAILCVDGVGEWATTTVWKGDQNKIDLQWQINFPHSLGLLYSAFTSYAGFKVNSGEYKLMGLAPYGNPEYLDLILDNIIDIKDDGSFWLDMSYFDYVIGNAMTSQKFNDLFGGEPRKAETEITQKEMDLACSIQVVIEKVLIRLCHTIYNETGLEYLCMAGGVALNCVANGRIVRELPFKDVWIQPASGDAGSSLGVALDVWYHHLKNNRVKKSLDAMNGAFLGGEFTNKQIKEFLNKTSASYKEVSDENLLPEVAELIKKGNVVGWFNGRMEFGPRSLGGRSIIGNPLSHKMQTIINKKIKYRESFRPFAPAVLANKANEWFDLDCDSPYMLLVTAVSSDKLVVTQGSENKFGIDKLKEVRSKIPAVTHVDNSARVQTVHEEYNPRFYSLITEFEKITGCPILINTSFNVRGEPIVYTPEDAYRCFMRTEMDYLVLENVLLSKKQQPPIEIEQDWKDEFVLD